MNCAQVRRLLPGYLDGALPERLGSRGHQRVGEHLQTCPDCRGELDRYLQISMAMSGVTAAAPPPELGVAIRAAISKARAEQGFARRMKRWKDHAEIVLENILEPLALPATGGLAAALLVFAVVYQMLGGAAMFVGTGGSDSPTNLLQPARLEMLAGFQMSKLEQSNSAGAQNPLLVEATVNAQGEAVSYRVISGRVDPAAQHELDQLLLFSKFTPQMSFGRPTSRGRVVLSFSQILVRG